MAFNFPTTLTGVAISGLTSPTMALTLDQNVGDERLAVISALGGTQTGVSAHSLSVPYLIRVKRPKSIKQLRAVSNGDKVINPPRNEWGIQLVKGSSFMAGQPTAPFLLELRAVVPAGAETADVNSIASGISAFVAFLVANPNALLDLIRTNQL